MIHLMFPQDEVARETGATEAYSRPKGKDAPSAQIVSTETKFLTKVFLFVVL